MLDADEQGFIDAAFDAAVEERVEEMEMTGVSINEVNVVLDDDEDVLSGAEGEEAGGDGQG
ncbi:MAG: hypothetical protein ACR2JU_04395 [Nocardioidaceae bacterium]